MVEEGEEGFQVVADFLVVVDFLAVVDSQVVVGLLPEVVEAEEDEGQEEGSEVAVDTEQSFIIDVMYLTSTALFNKNECTEFWRKGPVVYTIQH